MKLTLTTPELSKLVPCDPGTIYKAVREGTFALDHLSVGRKILFRTSDVERWLGLEPGTLSDRGGDPDG